MLDNIDQPKCTDYVDGVAFSWWGCDARSYSHSLFEYYGKDGIIVAYDVQKALSGAHLILQHCLNGLRQARTCGSVQAIHEALYLNGSHLDHFNCYTSSHQDAIREVYYSLKEEKQA